MKPFPISVVAWSPDGRTILVGDFDGVVRFWDVATRHPIEGTLEQTKATRIEVIWSGRDWQVVAPPDGDWGNAATRVTSLTGYTTFPAER